MLLNKTITIAGTVRNLLDDRVVLASNQAGRAKFTVSAARGDIKQYDQVAFDIGYADSDAIRLFLGYVENVVVLDNKRVALFCREMANLLDIPCPISLRHPTLTDVLNEVSSVCGLSFYHFDTGYQAPHFYNMGSGFNALTGCKTIFKIDDFFWQQQNDGEVFVGSWEKSRWKGKDIEIDEVYFTEHLANNSAVIAAIPALRPGVAVNGNRIKTLDFSSNNMTIAW